MPETATGRPDPEQLLRQVQAEERNHHRGLLKVFLGYASGVGKSMRMLEEARRRRQRGEDLVVVATQPKLSPEVERLLGKMEAIPVRLVQDVPVMDVPAILRRHPQVCVVDGLAYNNPPGSLHEKRWEDVEQLLAAGISVLGSVNLVHIAEYRERVEKITGKHVMETIPVNFLRSANEIEVVDAPAEMCLESAGPVQAKGAEPDPAVSRQQRLSGLREMALLLTADIVEHQLEEYLRRHGITPLWGTQERILVCIKAGTNALKMTESGQRNAARFHGELFVAHVRQPGLTPEEEAALEENLSRARILGAQIELLEGEDWVEATLRFARTRGITQIFISHSRKESLRERLFGSAVDRLIEGAEGMDIRVFPH
jgi:two-component system sensor histidine kinase KdpD